MKKKSFLFGYSQLLTWLLAWSFMSFCNMSSGIVYRPAVAALHGIDFATILQGHTFATIACLFVALVYPSIVNRFGAKKLSIVTTFLAAICYFMYPRMSNVVGVVIMGGLLMLFTQGFASISTMILVSKWFPRTKGKVMGIITAAGILSNSVMLPIFNAIMSASGVVAAMSVFAVVIAAWGVINIFWMRETPEEVGLMPDNKPMTDEDRAQLSMAANASKGSSLTYGKLIRVPKFWMACIGWGLILCALQMYSTTSAAFLGQRGISTTVAVTFVAAGGWVASGTSFVSGFLDAKIGTKITTWLVIVMAGVGFLLNLSTALIALPVAGLAIAYCMVGGSIGAPNNLYSSQALTLSGVADYAVFFGLYNCVLNLVQNLNGVVSGTLLKMTGDYYVGYGVAVALLVIGGILTSAAGYKKLNITGIKTADAA